MLTHTYYAENYASIIYLPLIIAPLPFSIAHAGKRSVAYLLAQPVKMHTSTENQESITWQYHAVNRALKLVKVGGAKVCSQINPTHCQCLLCNFFVPHHKLHI